MITSGHKKMKFMAGNTATKSRNQAFLAQHERQRLNKPCNRTIDLRGKVAGECQAYQFGGKTHYLDDRAYLLAKQLLNRFNGRYTIGVYESIQKALKLLSATNDTSIEKELDFILSRSRNKVQLIPFDSPLNRKESRIIFATPIDIHLEDMLYHGSTIDITSSAISIALKRVSTLKKGDQIHVNFTELATQPEFELLTNIPYSVLVIEHDNLRSRLILLRDRKDNHHITQQLDLWCKQHNSPEYLDLDNELFNLACNYYQHLYCRTLTSPQFWLSLNDADDPIKAFHLTPHSDATLSPLCEEDNKGLSYIPFNEIITRPCDLLLHISAQRAHIAYRHDHDQISSILNQHLSQTSSHLFLLRTQKATINLQDFENELYLIAKDELDYAKNLEKRLNSIDILTSVTDISSCCKMLNTAISKGNITNAVAWNNDTLAPTDHRYTISRQEPRYQIHTPVHVQFNNTTYKTTTADVSPSGLLVSLPGKFSLTIGSRVSIDFVRWQQQTSSVKLTELKYQVRSCRFWNGFTSIGLERDTVSTAYTINEFFNSTIKSNSSKLTRDNKDIITSQETKIFASVLSQYITTIPFYLGMDDENKRILQAVISTNNNYSSSLWLAFQNLVTMMSESLKSLSFEYADSTDFGIYCYQDQRDAWQIATEYDFNSIEEKSLFINLALANTKYHFFHCQLSPIKSTWFDQEIELNKQLLSLRNHSPHKVKQIKSVLLSLFAIGELTDITDIISANYTQKQ